VFDPDTGSSDILEYEDGIAISEVSRFVAALNEGA
jgi:hypothetical protein